ncbi:hypothetical protein SKAU_G00240110 [Synaphobranchus kaupii]|uniref:Uncharacterized protein n=1 Tax=Synaphobranchus kaupii TaxID=118154 RepID=A0A9Q1F7H2_SYNKA|nr:hypothetical protein SKAU_G00240110 [Synaphobranchus kaupii]
MAGGSVWRQPLKSRCTNTDILCTQLREAECCCLQLIACRRYCRSPASHSSSWEPLNTSAVSPDNGDITTGALDPETGMQSHTDGARGTGRRHRPIPFSMELVQKADLSELSVVPFQFYRDRPCACSVPILQRVAS